MFYIIIWFKHNKSSLIINVNIIFLQLKYIKNNREAFELNYKILRNIYILV